MRKIVKSILVAVLVLGVSYAQVTGYYQAQISANKQEGAKLESAIMFQRLYNHRYHARIATKHRIVRILDGFHSSLRHDPTLLAELILQKSEQHGLDPFLVLGMIQAESSFNSHAVSNKGAMGLMQIQPDTANLMVPNMDFDGETASLLISDSELNISLGTRYLAKMIRRFGNLETALEAYNRGPNAISRQMSDGDDLEPRYAGKVISHYHRFKSGTRL